MTQTSNMKRRLLALAARPEGVVTSDLSHLNSNSVGTAAWNMTKRGELFAVKECRSNRWFATKAARDAHAAKIAKQPPQAKIYSVAQPAIVIRGRAWDKNAPMHFPKDEKGRPLWKFTKCPGFTSDPPKSNTFTGAY